MNREAALIAAAVALAAVTTVGALAVPGAVANPTTSESVEPPGFAQVVEVTFAAEEVSGGTATLSIDTYLAHEGGDVENVTVVHRATDTATGLVEATTELEVGDLDGVETVDGDDRRSDLRHRFGSAGHTEHVVPGEIDLPREGDYEIETIVYEDDARVETVGRTIEGVDSLTPTYADTDVGFHHFGSRYGYGSSSLPAIRYAVDSVDGGEVTLEVASMLTNSGDDLESGLAVELVARQADSNVVADSATVDPGTIDPGETVQPTVDLTVPEGYDYSLDATLWKDGSIVGTERVAANIGPGELTVEDADREGGLQVSDFETDGEFDGVPDGDDAGDGTPGFGVVAGLLAFLLAVALARQFEPASGRIDAGADADTSGTADANGRHEVKQP